ncbi:unnamed protein product [Moneuplotes crassus]|uniref:Uncharacterized protein n=2 Tax=Euplotes crassus TaxID=5936 RepID=A0AAD2D6X1_EUPCR|nr:unnamed protein product [Moneuplotes crassus]CAI2383195.1 unnamed protein product [Moneuplotes crassus]
MDTEETPSFNFCYIMRGVPGSGKSTVAHKLCGENGVIHSTDNYFVNEEGVYEFDPSKIKEYHGQNYKDFKKSIDDKVETVVVDNTNVQEFEYKKYVEYATENGYVVSYVTLPFPDPEVAAERNSHGVPLEAIQRMMKKWRRI